MTRMEVVAHPYAPHSVLDDPDESLMLRYRDAGDIDAFETLVHRYEKSLFNYLLRYLHSGPLAEDVLQATFLRVHEKCHRFAVGRQFRPWLYRIATHLAIDALRKEGRPSHRKLGPRAYGQGDRWGKPA